MRHLDPAGCVALAEALGDTPETVISVHLLQRGLCNAYVAGDPLSIGAAVVQDKHLRSEPMAFGADAEALWQLLRCIDGWSCVDVPTEVAESLGDIMGAEMGRRIRHYGDIYHTMQRAAPRIENDDVRQLTLVDLELLKAAPAEVRGAGFGSTRALLSDGVVACGIVDGTVVAIAHTSARTTGYADIGVATLGSWRNRGLATAAASVVCERVQAAGQTPVWSCGEDNLASLRVAEKLGFVEVGRRTYLIPCDN